MNHLLTITQARALARIRTADTDAGLARKRELFARAVAWYASNVAQQQQQEQKPRKENHE